MITGVGRSDERDSGRLETLELGDRIHELLLAFQIRRQTDGLPVRGLLASGAGKVSG